VNALKESLGVDDCIKKRSLIKSEGEAIVSTFDDLANHFRRCIDVNGYINFDRVFDGASEAISPTTERIPVKFEICSGAGEWATAQAKEDGKRARWVTLELRNDRVYSTFSKAIIKNVTNLCLLAGDARRILPSRIAPGSVAAVFVNHPEPPQQTGRDISSQGAHLLDESFFCEILRILEGNGMLTIVTDNLWYFQKISCFNRITLNF
jgi:tRNA G46 methylase TrmB